MNCTCSEPSHRAGGASEPLVGSVALRLQGLEPGQTVRVREATPGQRRRLAGTVLVLDDNTLYRQNLAAALDANLDAEPRMAWNMASLSSALDECAPDVVLLSVSTSGSLALLQAVIASRPDAKVIAVGVWEGDESTIVACAEAGVTRISPSRRILRRSARTDGQGCPG